MGEHDISGELEAKRSITKNVKQIIVHRQYDPATFENDLALLQLESPVHYDTHIGKQKYRDDKAFGLNITFFLYFSAYLLTT